PNNSSVQLTQTDDTSLGQRVLLPDQTTDVEFDLKMLHAGAGDTLQVLLDGGVIGEVPLGAQLFASHHAFSLQGAAGRYATITFRLAGPVDDPSVIKLDNLLVDGQSNSAPLATPDENSVVAGHVLSVDP